MIKGHRNQWGSAPGHSASRFTHHSRDFHCAWEEVKKQSHGWKVGAPGSGIISLNPFNGSWQMLGTTWFTIIITAAEKQDEEVKRQSLERTSLENLCFTLECHTTLLNYQYKLYACIIMKTYVMVFGHFFHQKVASSFAAFIKFCGLTFHCYTVTL